MDKTPPDCASEILSVHEMYEADRLALSDVPNSFTLMQNAAHAVLEVSLGLLDNNDRVAVICGIGNNGGDGLLLSALLQLQGVPVSTVLCADRDRPIELKGDAARALDWFQTQGDGKLLTLDDLNIDQVIQQSGRSAQSQQQPLTLPSEFTDCRLIIDAVFGAGLSRPVTGRLATLIDVLNAWRTANNSHQQRKMILSIDLPSGINGDSGQICGTALAADHTVTFFRHKPAHWLYPGRSHCGTIHRRDIGISPSVLTKLKPSCHANNPGLWQQTIPSPSVSDHKYRRGHVLVQSGPVHATGAARLSALAALRAGAGVVTMASPTEAIPINASHLTEVMQTIVDNEHQFRQQLEDNPFDCVVLGPANGVTKELADKVCIALNDSNGPHVVLDADALSCFGHSGVEQPESLFSMIQHSNSIVVMTPHEGEFDRVFGQQQEINECTGKLERTKRAAALSGAIVVHKGADTVIASPDGETVINADSIPPSAQWLATAGSGDVLTGTIAGLLAQHKLNSIAMNTTRKHLATERSSPTEARLSGHEMAFKRTCFAVWLHTKAAQNVGPGLIASDIPAQYGSVVEPFFSN